MKKLVSVLIGILMFFGVVIGFKAYMDKTITEHLAEVRNLRTYERYWSSEVQKIVIEENTLPIFGSSELMPLEHYEDNISSFLNGEQMTIATIGGGNFQSLSHTMALGAISDSVQRGKVALFLSPQWFVEGGIDPAAFAARISENELIDFLYNPKISRENKLYVLDRTANLLSNSPTQLSRIKKYRHAVENPVSIESVYMSTLNWFWDYRSEYEVFMQIKNAPTDLPYYDLDSIDYSEMLERAQQQGDASCTNNSFGIYNEYWDTYVKDTYALGEVSEKKQVFTVSPEYDDLRCFLNVAKELDIEVILVSIPVNAQWYSYRGELCTEYYENIRQLVKPYDNVTFIDMTEYENEKYFFKDIMHLGWKGWTRINEALYKEFTEK